MEENQASLRGESVQHNAASGFSRFEDTDILAALARRSRRVWEVFCVIPRASLADSLCPGLFSFTPTGFRMDALRRIGCAKTAAD